MFHGTQSRPPRRNVSGGAICADVVTCIGEAAQQKRQVRPYGPLVVFNIYIGAAHRGLSRMHYCIHMKTRIVSDLTGKYEALRPLIHLWQASTNDLSVQRA
jgi:hypothetical protein